MYGCRRSGIFEFAKLCPAVHEGQVLVRVCIAACVSRCMCETPCHLHLCRSHGTDVGESLKLAQKLGKSVYNASAALFALFNPSSCMQHGHPYVH